MGLGNPYGDATENKLGLAIHFKTHWEVVRLTTVKYHKSYGYMIKFKTTTTRNGQILHPKQIGSELCHVTKIDFVVVKMNIIY